MYEKVLKNGENMLELTIVGGAILIVLVVVLTGRKLSAKVGNVEFQLTPNGGHSFRDEINKRLDVVELNQGNLINRVTKLEDKVCAKPQRNSKGQFTRNEN